MSANSKIEWTDHTFNPWIGCAKVSPGCDHCYAENLMATRMHKVVWGPHGTRVRTSLANWREPLKWNARHEAFFAEHGRRQRVFCASLADVFDNAVDPAWRRDLFALIARTPNLDWLLLTKRIGNAAAMLTDMFPTGTPENVWLGATVVNQTEADRDIPKLLATPASVRFLSMEPLLGPVDLSVIEVDGGCEVFPLGAGWLDRLEPGAPESPRIDWVIVGGESGAHARPIHPEWVRWLHFQCSTAGVPFFFKQWGEWVPMSRYVAGIPLHGRKFTHADGTLMGHAGKHAAGRLLDGRMHEAFPGYAR